MKRSVVVGLSWIFLSGIGTELVAQPTSMRIVINGQALQGTTEIRVRLGDQSRQLVLDTNRSATTVIPGVVEGEVDLTIEARQAGYWTRAWAKKIELNGSGNIVYVLNPDGTGSVGQWPAVTWDAKDGQLDVLVNGAAMGTTRMKRGVEPGRAHVFVWQQQGVRKCEKQISLPMNVKRVYACDPVSGVVSDGT